MKPVILFRHDYTNNDEFEEAVKIGCAGGIEVLCSRVAIPKDSLVIGRYSVLPYYSELETDLEILGSKLINSTAQHKHIADFDWYNDISDLTFESWYDWQVTSVPNVPLIVKGRTNSRKFDWNKLMYAENKIAAINIACELYKDSLIGPQGIVYRRYEPLEVVEVGLSDMPMTNEWRVFFLNGRLVSYGYYWSIVENVEEVAKRLKPGFIDDGGLQIAQWAAERLSVPFVAVDVAKTQEGQWKVVEVNDGQMSGLSTIDPKQFYEALAKVLHL